MNSGGQVEAMRERKSAYNINMLIDPGGENLMFAERARALPGLYIPQLKFLALPLVFSMRLSVIDEKPWCSQIEITSVSYRLLIDCLKGRLFTIRYTES